MKSQTEQPTLPSRQDSIRNIKKRLILKDALYDDPNGSMLLHDEKLPGPIACVGQIERRLNTFSHYWHEIDFRLRDTTARLSRFRRPTQQKT
jgi:hypothetical protein